MHTSADLLGHSWEVLVRHRWVLSEHLLQHFDWSWRTSQTRHWRAHWNEKFKRARFATKTTGPQQKLCFCSAQILLCEGMCWDTQPRSRNDWTLIQDSKEDLVGEDLVRASRHNVLIETLPAGSLGLPVVAEPTYKVEHESGLCKWSFLWLLLRYQFLLQLSISFTLESFCSQKWSDGIKIENLHTQKQSLRTVPTRGI